LNLAASSPVAIPQFTDHPGDFCFPIFSPDGARVAFVAYPSPGSGSGSGQIFVTTLNRNHAPVLNHVGDQSVRQSVEDITITLNATDLESDALTYVAYYLQDGMTFNPATRTFYWAPSVAASGKDFYVRFQVLDTSGGSDFEVIKIHVIPEFESRVAFQSLAGEVEPSLNVLRIRTAGGSFGLATLGVFDVRGRQVAAIRGRKGETIEWDPRKSAAGVLSRGIYFYRLVAGDQHLDGKWIYLP